MTFWPSLRRRASGPELLDDGVPEAEALRSLRDLRFVNRWLGDLGAAARAVERQLPERGRLLDVGAASGDLPRRVICKSRGAVFAVGLDAKSLHFRFAPEKLHRVVGDVRALPFAGRSFDVVTASLLLHHFADEELPPLLSSLYGLARRALVIEDLRRARVAYVFGWLLFPLLFRSRVSVYDGLLSIRRGFERDELRAAFLAASLPQATIERRFPYRLLAVVVRPGGAGVPAPGARP